MPDHVLIGFLAKSARLAARVLAKLGVSLEDVRLVLGRSDGGQAGGPRRGIGDEPADKGLSRQVGGDTSPRWLPCTTERYCR
jgi:Clp amino terminal domain, pathogenicity island component